MAPPRVREIYSYRELFSFLFFPSIHSQVRPLNGSLRTMAQTTQICAKMCLLGVRIFKNFALGSFPPKTPQNCPGTWKSQLNLSRRISLECYNTFTRMIVQTTQICARMCLFGSEFSKILFCLVFSSQNSPKSARTRETPAKIVKKNIS